PEANAHAEVEIEEAHMEDPAVGEHRNAGQQVPGPASGGGGDEGEGSPDERQHGDRNRDALREFGAYGAEKRVQQKVEQDVGGLADDDQALELAALNQLREPGIINMTGKIAGLDARLPVDGEQEKNRQEDKNPAAPAQRGELELPRRRRGFGRGRRRVGCGGS